MSAAPVPDRFRILFVCTGNVCRSPFAEILTRHLLGQRLGRRAAQFEVLSAGVQAAAGSPMHPDSRDQLVPWGLHRDAADGFVARQVDRPMIERADLVLGIGPEHRAVIVAEVPQALAKVFGLREFARLVDPVDPDALPAAPVERARCLVDAARRSRPHTLPRHAAVDDVPDPIGYPRHAHRAAAARITPAVEALVDRIVPAGR